MNSRLPAIAERDIELAGDVTGAVAEAERALEALRGALVQLPPGAPQLQLVRLEALASSRVEDIDAGHTTVARASLGLDEGAPGAADVFSHERVLLHALDISRAERPIFLADIRDLHALLFRGQLPDSELAPGAWRSVQSWIGRRGAHDAYTPPPPQDVPVLMDDLAAFLKRDDMAPVEHAALAHAQFESIHPFVDGNGRTGRALALSLLNRDAGPQSAFPALSLILLGDLRAYFDGLNAYRHEPPDEWIALFAAAVREAARLSLVVVERYAALRDSWLARLEGVRSDAAARRAVDVVAASGIVTSAGLRAALDVSYPAAANAISQLVDRGILQPASDARRDRAWEAPSLFDHLREIEALAADLARRL